MMSSLTTFRRSRGRAVALCAAACAAGLIGAVAAVPAEGGARQLMVSFDSTIGKGSLSGALARSSELDVVTSGGGSLRRVAGPDGFRSAVRTPVLAGGSTGQRAVLAISSADASALSPGLEDLLLRADFSIDEDSSLRASADNGDNLLQRGLFGAAQYKLQVDDRLPSCRVAGSEGAVMVRASDPILPGGWYRVSCKRRGSTLTLVVKEDHEETWRTVSKTTATGPIGEVNFSAEVPLSVGGKLNDSASLVVDASDQFNGRYADILLRFG